MSASSVNRGLTPHRRRWHVENGEFAAFTRRIVAAHGRRVATGDIEGLADLAALSAEVDDAMQSAIVGLRTAGFSWSDIGARLGMSRQAAHQRFGAAS